MKTLNYSVQFNTPAFLGDASQSGRWRTPPFKAQLRQWWRVAYAAEQNFNVDVQQMRDIEGHVFGHAWLKSDKDSKNNKVAARKSEVRIRLSHWDEGQMTQWSASDSRVLHPNVHYADGREKPIGAQLYLGYGPLVSKQDTALKDNGGITSVALQAGEQAGLAIAYPDRHASLIEHALHLMNLYGTVGGRSRNGWGSYSLSDTASNKPRPPSQSLEKCLCLDWPHALGTDTNGALIWQTAPHKDWPALMKILAQIKIGLRTQFKFNSGDNAPEPEGRHWLSYPVTRHSVKSWGGSARLPNQLRFKIRPTMDGQMVAVIFHMPHLPPAKFHPNLDNLLKIWRQVHRHLDQNPAQALTRIAA